MQGYECGKHNNNMKETLVLQSERKIQGKKIYWKLKILLGQLLLMCVALSRYFSHYAFEIFSNIVKELKLNETNTTLYPGFMYPFLNKNFKDISRTPISAKKSLKCTAFLVVPQQEQFYPEGLCWVG